MQHLKAPLMIDTLSVSSAVTEQCLIRCQGLLLANVQCYCYSVIILSIANVCPCLIQEKTVTCSNHPNSTNPVWEWFTWTADDPTKHRNYCEGKSIARDPQCYIIKLLYYPLFCLCQMKAIWKSQCFIDMNPVWCLG